MANWRRLRAGIERLEEHRAVRRLDASPWDWYAPGCPCGRPAGECRKHPRARANQRPPEGDWRTWLLLMGRGAGKTRAAAEWVRRRIESGAAGRIALVGATAADVRDTMVDGQSGLLAISPPWFRPRYEPTRRRLTWPNGARATTFTADEPDRLRGPEHDGAWCLAGDTRVLMADGSEKPIAAVRGGEMVATPIGPRRVLAAVLTRRGAEVYRVNIAGGRSIIGTADHPVRMATGEFVPIRSLIPGMEACVADASSGEAGPGTSGLGGTTSPRSASIARSGWPLTARSPRAITSTTRTETRPTIGWRILRPSPTASTAPGTSPRRSGHTAQGDRQFARGPTAKHREAQATPAPVRHLRHDLSQRVP